MRAEARAVLGLVVMGLAGGCGLFGGDTKKKQDEPDEKKAEAPKSADRSADPAPSSSGAPLASPPPVALAPKASGAASASGAPAPGGGTGIPECDALIARMEACLPAAGKAGLGQLRAGYAQAAAIPQARATMAKTCSDQLSSNAALKNCGASPAASGSAR